ncbi:hypothetical protein CSKR_107028 [Clonorchis sinensis]|uniref:Uncharacterized protein n=1 Tax=Clonorchis sinensis TaxID=79923 RepID=A0A419PD97_CLOSI|nr:hypothetical protein CSKR_107028 [Clonorchis sinensis]
MDAGGNEDVLSGRVLGVKSAQYPAIPGLETQFAIIHPTWSVIYIPIGPQTDQKNICDLKLASPYLCKFPWPTQKPRCSQNYTSQPNHLKHDVRYGAVQKPKYGSAMMAQHWHTQFDSTPATNPFLLSTVPFRPLGPLPATTNKLMLNSECNLMIMLPTSCERTLLLPYTLVSRIQWRGRWESFPRGDTDSRIHGLTDSRIHGFTDSRIHGFTDSRIHGFTDSRIHGFTDSRIHGFTDSRIHGFTDSRIHGFTDSRIHGFTDSRIHGFTDSRIHGFTDSRIHGFTDSRIHGFTDSRIHGFTDSRIHGFTDSRIHGFTDSRIHGFTDSRIHGFTDSRIHGFTDSRILKELVRVYTRGSCFQELSGSSDAVDGSHFPERLVCFRSAKTEIFLGRELLQSDITSSLEYSRR